MHQRIIWTLFFTAFILDIFRIRSEKATKREIHPNINKQKEQKTEVGDLRIPTEEKKFPEKNEDDFEKDEEIKVVDNFKKKEKEI